MTLSKRIDLLAQLSRFLQSNDADWQAAKERAEIANPWFTQEMIAAAVTNICEQFLVPEKLAAWVAAYEVPEAQPAKKTVGLVMAGNLPLVGFHDWLAVFVTGHYSLVKLSAKDAVLLQAIIRFLGELTPEIQSYTGMADQLKNCDAYIATGSNNSGRYFEYYFGKYPHIIRKNKTSAAVLTGEETQEELDSLAYDICLYFGMGCRNVTQLYVPKDYDFIPLIQALRAYDYMLDHNKLKNNYDYQLALLIMNNRQYMTGGPVILVESNALFAPVSVLNYHFYLSPEEVIDQLQLNDGLQCQVGFHGLPFGRAQSPELDDYADRVDTMKFLQTL